MTVNRFAENISPDDSGMGRPAKKVAAPGTFGYRLKYWREKRDIERDDLAKAMGIAKSSLSELESGSSKQPMGLVLIRAADKLRITPKHLMTGEGPAEILSLHELNGLEGELITYYRQLPDDTWRDMLLIDANDMLNRARKGEKPSVANPFPDVPKPPPTPTKAPTSHGVAPRGGKVKPADQERKR